MLNWLLAVCFFCHLVGCDCLIGLIRLLDFANYFGGLLVCIASILMFMGLVVVFLRF